MIEFIPIKYSKNGLLDMPSFSITLNNGELRMFKTQNKN